MTSISNIATRVKKQVQSGLRRSVGSRGHRPRRISIELTNRCNLNCPFCLVGLQNDQESVAHHDLGRQWGKMDLGLAEKIISDSADFGIQEVMLTFQGEPLLHPQFVNFVELVKDHNMKAVLFTNGLLLSAEKSTSIIRAGLHSIRFSVDGASQDVYQLNRVGGKFEKVYRNMAEFIQIKNEENSPIYVMWQFIAMRNNEHEIEKAREMAEAIGIPFFVKTFAESIPDLAPVTPEYQRKPLVKPCLDIYRNIFCFWDGSVVPCCFDLRGKELMGNLNENTLEEIWNGPRYVEFRRLLSGVSDNPEKEPELCKSCLKWSAKNS